MLRDLDIEVLSLQSFPGVPEVEEDGATFHENALKKAREVSRHTSEVVLADDSGLEVDILGGRAGDPLGKVFGARRLPTRPTT